ncbi:MAG: glutamate synthase large subunit, partial [Candidatus Macondimonas sp.]
AQGLDLAGWRLVPTDPSACGNEALKTLPHIEQVFVNAPAGMERGEFQRRLFLARRQAEKALESQDPHFYMPSLAVDVIAYKGLVMPANLPVFFRDLDDARMESSLAVFHQRFSTNTWPQWRLAQPFRYLAHNGEINTVQGNRNWALARAKLFRTPLLPDIEAIQPIVSLTGSDSQSLDNMLEVLLAGGMDMFRAMRLLMPPAWQNLDTLDPDLRAFYEFNSMHMEPWDGPAGIVLTDGRYAACAMDRNGLRPARYVITRDRHITLASEVGVYDYAPEDVLIKGRLKPGQMIAADTATGQILYPADIDNLLKSRHPYKQWLKEQVRHIESKLHYRRLTSAPLSTDQIQVFQKLFGVSFEERDQILRVLGEAGQEAVGSMGDDTPFAILSQRNRSLYDFFRQQFAQVTNPPIDPLREQVVMSLKTCLGPERNVFEETPEHANRLMLDSPVLTEGKYQNLMDLVRAGFDHQSLDLNYPTDIPLEAALTDLCERAEAAVTAGKVFLILDDRAVARDTYPVHALLATGAVHHHLAAKGLRCSANLIVATATARDPHHFAVLLGYGATAIYPYLAYEMLHQMAQSGEIPAAAHPDLVQNYRKGINKGLYKIISKMGISTIASYRGAQLFEIVGLHEEVVTRCFKGTVSRIQGARFAHLDESIRQLAWRAWNPRKLMDHGGLLKYVHGGEYHAFNPDVIAALQQAVSSGDYSHYKAFAALVEQRPTATLRDLLAVRE